MKTKSTSSSTFQRGSTRRERWPGVWGSHRKWWAEYHIYKLCAEGPEPWDGPFKTLKEARQVFRTKYDREAFGIVRHTHEAVTR